MALNINTNITNNLDGYLLDAKNIKGSYVVVADYSELANLPSACVVEGTLVYCQSDYSIYGAGFYQYNGSIWEKTAINKDDKVPTIIIDSTNAFSNLDVTQTYTWSNSSVNTAFTNLPLNKINVAPLIFIAFTNYSFGFNYITGLSNTTIITGSGHNYATQIFELNDKQYIATLDITVGSSSNNLTLSFSEIEGDGGSQASEQFTKIKLHTTTTQTWSDPNNVSPDITETLTEYFTYIIPKSNDIFIVGYANALLSENFTSLDELFTYLNTAITSSGSTDGTMVMLYRMMCEILSHYTPYKIELNYDYKDEYSTPVENITDYAMVVQLDNAELKAYIGFNNSTGQGSSVGFLPDKIYQIEYSDYSFGGDNTTTEKMYEWELVCSVNSSAYTRKLKATISETQMQEVYTEINDVMSTSISTPAEIISIYDTIKADNLYASPYFDLLCSLFANLCQFSMNNGGATYIKDEESNQELYPTVSTPNMVYTFYISNINWFLDELTEVTISNMSISFDANSVLTITEKEGTSSSGSGTTETGIDYMQVELPNGCLYLTFAKGCFEGQFATDLNSAIATINTAYGTSIPNFESIESWKTIYDYLTGLGSSYVALAVMWLSVFFYNGCYFALSQKCMYNGEFCPVSIEAIADMQNQSFSYAIKYLSANSSPLAFAEATSSSNYVQLDFNINELE